MADETLKDAARRVMGQVRCKDDVTNPYDADNPDWTPTNLQIRYCMEDLMNLVALCMVTLAKLTDIDITESDEDYSSEKQVH